VDLRQLRYFVHAANSQNLTHASGKAWVSQSALSRQIKLLEEDLGVSLFVRLARGVKLTPAGDALLQRAQLLLEEADSLKRSIGRSPHEVAGTLRVGVPTSLSSLLLSPWAHEYHRRHPAVLLSIKSGTSRGMRDALAMRELDVGIASTEEQLEAFALTPLVTEALCWVGPPDAGLLMKKPASVARLARQPLIQTAHPNALRVIVDRALSQVGLRLRPVAEGDAASTMLDWVHQGLGFTVLPYSGIHQALQAGYVSACLIRDLRVTWVIARSRERMPPLSTELAIDLLERTCATTVAKGAWATARLPTFASESQRPARSGSGRPRRATSIRSLG
jgi:LysR family transcriptional regulator, nitrogen assimilation regulatory protein